MSDAQPQVKQYEFVLKEALETERTFAKNMALLASLKSAIEQAIEKDLNKDASPEMKEHQTVVLNYLASIEAIQKSSAEMVTLLSQAVEMANKIEKGEASPEESQAHQKKLDTVLDSHIKNISHSTYLFKRFKMDDHLNPDKTSLPLNDFIQEWIIQKQSNGETTYNNISNLIIMPVQRIPRYAILATDLEKKIKEDEAPNLKAEHVLFSSEKAAKAAAALNQKTDQAAKENRMITFQSVMTAITPSSEQSLAKAEFALKEMIEDGISLSNELKKEGIGLGDLVIKIKQGRKIEAVQLKSPEEKHVGETAANVIAGYIKAGFPIQFDDSIHAAKLWQDTLKKGIPDEKMAPIVIDLPPELLKNTALLRQTMKTASMLQEKGFDVQTTPRFKKALEAHQQKTYGFFNIVARIKQFNFKTEAKQFNNMVQTFKPTPPPRPTIALPLPLVEISAETKIKQKQEKEAENQAVMTPPKKKFLASPGVPNKTRKQTFHSLSEHRKKTSSEPTVKRPRNE